MSNQPPQSLAKLLAIDELPPEDQATILEETGQLVFEASLTRFLQEVDDSTAGAFTEFVDTHQNEEAFFDVLFAEYPRFAVIYEEELAALQSDVLSEMSDVSET